MKRSIRISVVVALVGVIISLPNTSMAYQYGGARWSGSWPNVPVDPSGLLVTAWVNTAKIAMSDWNAAGAKFSFSNQQPANNTMYYYYQASDVLAVATVYKSFWSGNVTKAKIGVNNRHNFNPPYASGTYFDLRSVLRHELGHWLTLNHSTDRSAVMYQSFGSGEVRGIGTDDRNGIRSIYGVR